MAGVGRTALVVAVLCLAASVGVEGGETSKWKKFEWVLHGELPSKVIPPEDVFEKYKNTPIELAPVVDSPDEVLYKNEVWTNAKSETLSGNRNVKDVMRGKKEQENPIQALKPPLFRGLLELESRKTVGQESVDIFPRMMKLVDDGNGKKKVVVLAFKEEESYGDEPDYAPTIVRVDYTYPTGHIRSTNAPFVNMLFKAYSSLRTGESIYFTENSDVSNLERVEGGYSGKIFGFLFGTEPKLYEFGSAGHPGHTVDNVPMESAELTGFRSAFQRLLHNAYNKEEISLEGPSGDSMSRYLMKTSRLNLYSKISATMPCFSDGVYKDVNVIDVFRNRLPLASCASALAPVSKKMVLDALASYQDDGEENDDDSDTSSLSGDADEMREWLVRLRKCIQAPDSCDNGEMKAFVEQYVLTNAVPMAGLVKPQNSGEPNVFQNLAEHNFRTVIATYSAVSKGLGADVSDDDRSAMLGAVSTVAAVYGVASEVSWTDREGSANTLVALPNSHERLFKRSDAARVVEATVAILKGGRSSEQLMALVEQSNGPAVFAKRTLPADKRNRVTGALDRVVERVKALCGIAGDTAGAGRCQVLVDKSDEIVAAVRDEPVVASNEVFSGVHTADMLQMYNIIRDAAGKFPMVAATRNVKRSDMEAGEWAQGIVFGHAYAVKGVSEFNGEKFVEFINPWKSRSGTEYKQSSVLPSPKKNSNLRVPLPLFFIYFQRVTICDKCPEASLETRQWMQKFFSSEPIDWELVDSEYSDFKTDLHMPDIEPPPTRYTAEMTMTVSTGETTGEQRATYYTDIPSGRVLVATTETKEDGSMRKVNTGQLILSTSTRKGIVEYQYNAEESSCHAERIDGRPAGFGDIGMDVFATVRLCKHKNVQALPLTVSCYHVDRENIRGAVAEHYQVKVTKDDDDTPEIIDYYARPYTHEPVRLVLHGDKQDVVNDVTKWYSEVDDAVFAVPSYCDEPPENLEDDTAVAGSGVASAEVLDSPAVVRDGDVKTE